MDSLAARTALAQGQVGQTAVNIGVVWIVVAVVVVLLLIALVVGLVTARRRRVNLRADRPDQTPDKPREVYRGTGAISFSAGTGTAERPAPPAGDGTADPASNGLAPAPPAKPAPPVQPVPPSEAAPPRTTPRPSEAAPERPEPAEPVPPAAPERPESAEPVPPAAPERPEPVEPVPPVPPAEPVPPTTELAPPAPPAPAAQPEPPRTPAPPPSAAPPRTGPAAAAPAPAVAASPTLQPSAPAETIEPAEGRLERLRGRLAGSRSAFGQGLLGLLGGGELDEESWEEVEDTLLLADLGADTTAELVGTLRAEIAAKGARTPEQARQLLHEVLTAALLPELDRSVRALPHDGRPAVVLVAGVNGTGKTTTTGKLARVLVAGGRTVVLGAVDTFRAAAAEQLVTWGERAGAEVVRGPEGADPASVAFEAVKRAAESGADAVLLDTAGRLHTKAGLMDELSKIKRVVSRQGDVDEVLLVLDATTG
ncbi:MAG: fused signal recognition particle receptor, partial [Pseudonocardiales bacterium]|nr:fused signal recognition particle receptor [Pseudonocardiales bacterium]